MNIERFQPGTRLSQCVACGGLLFLAGQVASRKEADAQTQTREILAKIEALLAEAGGSKTSVLSATIWLADMADFQAMNSVWDAWVVPGHLPARACVEGKLAYPELRVEIMVIAARVDAAT